MAIINLNQTDFYYELHGKGEPIVLISGYAADHMGWLPLLDNLSQHFQLLLLDNRAVGQTKDQGKEFSIDSMATDVMMLVEKLNLTKPHIVGHSMGGNIAQSIASHYPDKINKLCLLSTTAKWREAMLYSLRNSLRMREQNIDIDILLDNVIPWLFGSEFIRNKKNIDLFKKLIKENPYFQSLHDQQRQFKALENFNGMEKLKNILAPTLIVYGIQDILSLPYESEYLAKHIPQTTLMDLDCGHALVLEKSQEVAKNLVQFLKD